MEASSSPVREYFRTAFRWQRGRQQSGYDKMLLLQALWPLPFDIHILHFPDGSQIFPHTDAIALGQHYRCNIVVKRAKAGGNFICHAPIFATNRIKIFRPDACDAC